MRHDQTVIIMLYFQKSKSKVGKAMAEINAIMESKSVISSNKMHMFLPIMEEKEMNQIFFVKNKKTKKFDRVEYDISHFDILKLNEFEIEFRATSSEKSVYYDGSVFFNLKKKYN